MASPPSLSASATAIRTSVFAELGGRIDAYLARGGRLIPLHIGDTHVAPPPGATMGAVADGGAPDPALYRYGPIPGHPPLRDAVAERFRARGGDLAGVEGARHVLVGCGATHALFCAARAVLDPGDEVLLCAPYWPLAPGVLQACGARPVEVPLTSLLYDDPSIDPADPLREAIGPRTAGIYLITPNNPDGKVLSRAQLESVARLSHERNLWVLADEVYADFAYDAPHVSIASLPGMFDRTVTACSFSKSHALAGARVGCVVASASVVEAARRVATHTVYNTPLLMQRLALAALGAGPGWVEAARETYRRARDAAVEGLRGAPVRFAVAEGGAYLFVDFSDLLAGRPLRAVLEPAIDRGVLLAPGDAFGRGYERCARLCFTSVPPAELADGVARLREAIEAAGGG